MGKKNWNKRENRLKKQQLDRGWSIAILDVRKELEYSEQRNDDFISSLPDDILCHIISFLPFKSAVQTSFLSTRWKNLWKRNFLVRKETLDDVFLAISSSLHSSNSDQSSNYPHQPTRNWWFQFDFGKGGFLSAAAEPDKALHLDFSNVKREFPWRFDWSLEINGPSYNSWFDFWFAIDRLHQLPTRQPSPFTFKVKTLHLKSVSYLCSAAISSMMPNFKFLENLTIEKCIGMRSLKIETGEPGLKKLIILDCERLECLHLNGYSLKSLRYRGKLLCFQCGDGGSSSYLFWPWHNAFYLVDAMLDFRQGPGCSNTSNCELMSIFNRMRGVKSLTLCRWVFEALIYPVLLSPPYSWGWSINQFNQLKEFWWIDYSKDHRYNSNALISFLMLCPRLTRLYITIDPKSYKRTNTTNCNLAELITRITRLEDLKVVKLEGFPNEKEEILLAKRLKQEFDVEPVIVAKSNYLNCVRLLVKSSPDHDDHQMLREGEDSYKFIETRVEHLHDLCPKHVHMCY